MRMVGPVRVMWRSTWKWRGQRKKCYMAPHFIKVNWDKSVDEDKDKCGKYLDVGGMDCFEMGNFDDSDDEELEIYGGFFLVKQSKERVR